MRERWWHPDAPWPLVFLLRSAAAQVQVQKPTEAVLFWWQRARHPAVTSIPVKLVWGFSLRLFQMCTAVSLTRSTGVRSINRKLWQRSHPVSVYPADSQEARHMFPGNICNSYHFQNKHKELAELVNLKWAHVLAYPASPLGPHVRRMLLSVRTPPLPPSAVGTNIWEGVTERKSSGLYRTILFAIATVPDNVARISHQTNRICYRFSWPVWIEYPN